MKKIIAMLAVFLALPLTSSAQCPPIVSQFQSSQFSTLNSFQVMPSFQTFQTFPVQNFGFNSVAFVGSPPIVSSSVFLATPVFSTNVVAVQNRGFSARTNINVRNRGGFFGGNRQVIRQRTVIR